MELPNHLLNTSMPKSNPPQSGVDLRLPLFDMPFEKFERFCRDLVEKIIEKEVRGDIYDVKSIGKQGQKQYGADIFASIATTNGVVYRLYEVKRVKNYNLAYYKQTVERFLENLNSWGDISEFIVFVADNISAESMRLYLKESRKLNPKNIKYEIWDQSRINKEAKNYPELIFQYFGDSWVKACFGDSGVFHIKKYGIYNFKESASWQNYEGKKLEVSGNHLNYINDHVRIQAFLPTVDRPTISCLIEFRNGRFSHVLTTLGHRDILERYFVGVHSPIEQGNRPYILKSFSDEKYHCDIGNCRIELSENEIAAICAAIDILWKEYRTNIIDIEKLFRSKFFKCESSISDGIPLLSMKRGLWALLLDFAQAHDVESGESKWHIFTDSHSWLKIFTDKEAQDMSWGYHALVRPYKYSGFDNYRFPDDDVTIVWLFPNNSIGPHYGKVGPRYYWDALTTYNWLINDLIPCALKWEEDKRHKNAPFLAKVRKKKPKPIREYDPQNYIISKYDRCSSLTENQISTLDEFRDIIANAQYFLNSCPNKRFGIFGETYSLIYKALYLVMDRVKNIEFNYVHSNLNYFKVSTIDELKAAVKNHSNQNNAYCTNTFRIDCVFRSIKACIDEKTCNLNSYEVEELAEHLKPLFEHIEDIRLIQRQIALTE